VSRTLVPIPILKNCIGSYQTVVALSTAPDNRVFTNAEKHSRQTGSGLMLTEFGAITTPAVITSQMDLAARNRVGVQWWAYTAGDPTTPV
jgi:hypothetical protein